MVSQINCVVIDANEANRTELANYLANCGVNVVWRGGSVEGLPGVLTVQSPPQMVMINLDPNPAEAIKRVGPLARQFPGVSFLVLSQTLDPQLLMEAMHYGIREFVPLPINEDRFKAGIERVASLHGMGKRATIVHLIPAQGGCGSTTIACNIAASLAVTHKTVLIDMDLVRGAAATSFDLHPRYTIADVMDSSDRLDPQLLDNALSLHAPSGLAVLARPEQPEDAQRVSQAGMTRLLNVLSRMYDYVVVDSRMSIDPVYNTLLLAADINMLVMQLNVPSAKNTERFVNAMRRLGVDSSKMRIVVNRYVKKGWDIAPEEVERTLALKIDWLIPNDFKNAIAALNVGVPAVLRTPRAEMSLSLTDLAGNLTRKAA